MSVRVTEEHEGSNENIKEEHKEQLDEKSEEDEIVRNTKSRTLRNMFICLAIFSSFIIGYISCFYGNDYLMSQNGTLEQDKTTEYEKRKNEISKFITELQPKLDPNIVRLYASNIVRYSKKYKIPEGLIAAIIFRESSFNQLAVSSSGAVGPMQIMVNVHKELLKEKEISRKESHYVGNNIMLGCEILNNYYNSTDSVSEMLTKYVGGDHEQYVKDILDTYTRFSIESRKNRF